MNNEKTVNSTIKDSTVKATPKKKKMKETSEIPLKHGKLLTTIMTIVTLVYVCPIFIVLMNSFKANTFVKTDTFAWPTGEALVGWANYIKGFTFGNYPFFKSVLYSFVITVLSTALILICTSMAAWYIARVDSMVCKIVYYLFVFSMVVPFQMVMFTLSNTADSLELNTPWTIPVIYLGFGAGMAVFMFTGFIKGLPLEIEEAAAIDGCGPIRTFFIVIIPMLKPGIFAGMLLAFTMSLDDFVVSYFVTGNGVSNISIVVYNMTKRTNPTINALSTLLILVVVLILVGVNVIPALAKKRHKKVEMSASHNSPLKKIGVAVATVGVLAVAVFCGARFSAISSKPVLRVYNSGEYMDTSLIEDFQKEYNCKVVYETFDSNETMYTKLQSGAEYDVIIPSDYMIERLISEDYLQPIDWKLITNKDKIIPKLLKNDFDPDNKYTVPYYWGTVGILYDKTVVDENDLKEGWNILRNKKYSGQIYMYDSERDSFMVALKGLGYSMNTRNKDELKQAYNWLIEQNNTMKPVYVGDDVMDNMISGNKAML